MANTLLNVLESVDSEKLFIGNIAHCSTAFDCSVSCRLEPCSRSHEMIMPNITNHKGLIGYHSESALINESAEVSVSFCPDLKLSSTIIFTVGYRPPSK